MFSKKPNSSHEHETKREAKTAANKRVLELLSEQGANFEEPQEVDFFFYGSESGLLNVKTLLLAQGYTTQQADLSEGLLVVQRALPLNQLENLFIINSLEILAKENEVEFDGWGTGVDAKI